MCFQGTRVERLGERWKRQTGFDKEDTTLDGSFCGETVDEMRPTTFPTGESIQFNATSEDIFIDNALRIDVVCNSFTIRTIPDTEFSNIQT
jgi:hypothetical protein